MGGRDASIRHGSNNCNGWNSILVSSKGPSKVAEVSKPDGCISYKNPQPLFQKQEKEGKEGCAISEDFKRFGHIGFPSNILEKDITLDTSPVNIVCRSIGITEKRQKRKRRDWPTPICSPKDKSWVIGKNGSNLASKTRAILAVDIMHMNLSQLHNLREELNLEWHSKISKAELQRRLIVYLKRKEDGNFLKSVDASHWSPPCELPKPHNADFPLHKQVLGGVAREEKSLQSKGDLSPRNREVGQIIECLTDSRSLPKVENSKLLQNVISGHISNLIDGKSYGGRALTKENFVDNDVFVGRDTLSSVKDKENSLIKEVEALRSAVSVKEKSTHF